jgi:hypothetical protein
LFPTLPLAYGLKSGAFMQMPDNVFLWRVRNE